MPLLFDTSWGSIATSFIDALMYNILEINATFLLVLSIDATANWSCTFSRVFLLTVYLL